jgi:hypothetical protein
MATTEIDNGIRVVDGTANLPSVGAAHPSIDEDFESGKAFDEIPVESLEDTPKVKPEVKPKEEPKEEEPVDEVIEDEPVEETPEDEPKEEPKPEESTLIYEKELVQSQKDLSDTYKQYADLYQEFQAIPVPEAPKKPTDQYDEAGQAQYQEEMAQYRADLSVYKQQQALTKIKVNQFTTRRDEIAIKQAQQFKAAHPNDKNIDKFEGWVRTNQEFFVAYTSGKVNLENLYSLYKSTNGIVDKMKAQIKSVQKPGVKVKPVSTKSTESATAETGTNGLPAQYKYANMGMFKELVKHYRTNGSMTGERMSMKQIDDICKQEYSISKSKNVF